MVARDKDWVLIVWTICLFLFDVFLLTGTSYLVFWKDASGWWFLLAILGGYAPTWFEVIRKKYGLPEK